MITTTSSPSRVRVGRRLTVSAAAAACILAFPLAGGAQAQSNGAAAAQYNIPPVTTTTPATTTDPDTDVADNGDDTSTGDGSGSATDDAGGSSNGGASNGGGSGSGTGSGSTGSGAAGTGGSSSTTPTPTPVDYAAFGLADRNVRDDVRAALIQGNLQYRYVATTNKKIVDFIGSSLGKQLSTGGARPIGRRTGEVLTGNGPLAANVFTTIFGTKFSYRPFTATVLTRGDDVSAQQVAFLRGLAAGFGGAPVPTVYVERSDDKESHVDEFENIPGVSVVDDIDTAAGKQELVRLLTANGGAVPGASGGSIDAQTQSAIANVGDDSSSSMPLILLALVVLGGVVFTGGTLVRRRR